MSKVSIKSCHLITPNNEWIWTLLFAVQDEGSGMGWGGMQSLFVAASEHNRYMNLSLYQFSNSVQQLASEYCASTTLKEFVSEFTYHLAEAHPIELCFEFLHTWRNKPIRLEHFRLQLSMSLNLFEELKFGWRAAYVSHTNIFCTRPSFNWVILVNVIFLAWLLFP